MMADPMRMSSILPSIKCSTCSQDIPLSQMGEHVCGVVSEPLPPLDPRVNVRPKLYNQGSPQRDPLPSKQGRFLPPRVDTSAANRPFLRNDQLTPASSSSDSRSVSPRTPYDAIKSPYGRGPAPMNRNPPSPEILSSNMDSAFPHFPPPKTSPNNDSRGRIGDKLGYKYAMADSAYAPMSPREPNAGGLLKRMDSIAPGPFDINGRRDQGDNRQQPFSNRGGDLPRPSTSHDNRSHARKISMTRNEPSRAMTPDPSGDRSAGGPRIPRAGGYGGFDSPASQESVPDMLRPENRSNTFPKIGPGATNGLPRRPSDLSSRSRPDLMGANGMDDRSPPRQGRRPSTSGRDQPRAPPRGPSLSRNRSEAAKKINYDNEFGIGNPYHTPSDSQSSTGSRQSNASKTSSNSSPPSSGDRGPSRRKPSDTSNLSALMRDIQMTMDEDKASNSRPRNQEQAGKGALASKDLAPSLFMQDSFNDGANQTGRLSPRSQYPEFGRPDFSKPQRRPTTAKGDCKACGEPIRGKSVSSADGRLTGRYHKQCFVCKTCNEPFATSEFYVLNDAPYCERHYHKLNHSLCQSCDKGIEGQYLETERREKYHPKCLTCEDCRLVLRDDYFEMNGKVYCERDAYRRAQQRTYLGAGGGSNRMERRRTRMMMMA